MEMHKGLRILPWESMIMHEGLDGIRNTQRNGSYFKERDMQMEETLQVKDCLRGL